MDIELDVESIIDDEEGCQKRSSRSKILVTRHAEIRSLERNVSYDQRLDVIRNGIREHTEKGGWTFTASGVTVLTNCDESSIITVWRTPGHGIVLNKVAITPEMSEAHTKED
jgi:hypothetical protein